MSFLLLKMIKSLPVTKIKWPSNSPGPLLVWLSEIHFHMNKEIGQREWSTGCSHKAQGSNNLTKKASLKLYKISSTEVWHSAYLTYFVHVFPIAIDGINEVPLPLSNFYMDCNAYFHLSSSMKWCVQELLFQSNATINFIQGDTTRRGKPPSRDNHCVQNTPQNKIRNSKAPPPGHKDRKFWHCLKWKALLSQQIKRFFNEETIKICIIWRSPDSNYGRTKPCMIQINVC